MRLWLCQTEFQMLMFSVSLKRCLPVMKENILCFQALAKRVETQSFFAVLEERTVKNTSKQLQCVYLHTHTHTHTHTYITVQARVIRDNHHISKSKAVDAAFTDHSREGPEQIVGIEEVGCPTISQYNCRKDSNIVNCSYLENVYYKKLFHLYFPWKSFHFNLPFARGGIVITT